MEKARGGPNSVSHVERAGWFRAFLRLSRRRVVGQHVADGTLEKITAICRKTTYPAPCFHRRGPGS